MLELPVLFFATSFHLQCYFSCRIPPPPPHLWPYLLLRGGRTSKWSRLPWCEVWEMAPIYLAALLLSLCKQNAEPQWQLRAELPVFPWSFPTLAALLFFLMGRVIFCDKGRALDSSGRNCSPFWLVLERSFRSNCPGAKISAGLKQRALAIWIQ